MLIWLTLGQNLWWGLMVSRHAGVHLIIKDSMVMWANKAIKCIGFDKPSCKVSRWVMFVLFSISWTEICLGENWVWIIPAGVKSKNAFNYFCCQLLHTDQRGQLVKIKNRSLERTWDDAQEAWVLKCHPHCLFLSIWIKCLTFSVFQS